MLKGISPLLGPELLHALCEMGHSDTLVIADGNFPAQTVGKNAKVIRADGIGGREMLRAILTVLPLDTYVKQPVILMAKVPGDNVPTPIWDEYAVEVAQADRRGEEAIGFEERFAFYEKAKNAHLIIATSESALYANVMLQKGVVI